MKTRIFQRGDWICGAISALAAFAGYAWTTAPSVTLLDSGEFLVAAQHFGVPHPTGYPLWTILAWLFHFLPLGNVAWQTALFSGVCGALAVGLTTMLIRSTTLWMSPDADSAVRNAASICAVSFGLVFAFSFSMWSQAVIVEVYTLHALLIGFYLTSLYAWARNPQSLAGLYWSFFTLSLAFSNHQLTLVFALVPLQFLIVILLRRDLFWDLVLALAVCALIAFLGFAAISDDPLVVRAAFRLSLLILTVLAIALVLNRGRMHWTLMFLLPFVLFAGLLPYAYMPFASSTNPPMNWAYTRTVEGFFYSFNRSQYPGTLSDLSLRFLGNVLGVPANSPEATDFRALFGGLWKWSGFFWGQLLRSFSPLGIVFIIAAFVGVLRKPTAARVWIYVLIVAFALAMTVQPVLEHAGTDKGGWWIQMPYHTYTNMIFGVICGVGAFFSCRWLAARTLALRQVVWLLLLLPAWPIYFNVDSASQRGHWFGWQYGYDMLTPLPRGSVIFGGTDAGRFVPTYMIFGESTLPPRQRVDPSFDRRDLYIITQNGLNDRYYLDYIRDHYSAQRPRVKNSFEQWLGRAKAYPDAPLILPTLEEMQAIREQTAKAARDGSTPMTGIEVHEAAIGATAKWIFEKNKDRHAFYVQESFPMEWSYDYAVPEGLLYRINPTPLPKLPDDVVEKDLAFWKDYIARLEADPAFAKDMDAQKSFSTLRLTGGRIYEHRKLYAAAETAYRQALKLYVGNTYALVGLSHILGKRGDFGEMIRLLELAHADDPANETITLQWAEAVARKEGQAKIEALLTQWRAAPTNLEPLEKVVTMYLEFGEPLKSDDVLREAVGKIGGDPAFLAFVVQISEAQYLWSQSAEAADQWTKIEPDSARAFYHLARAQYATGNVKDSMQSLGKAIDLGGVEYREHIFNDPVFQTLRDVPELKRLMLAPPPSGANKSAP